MERSEIVLERIKETWPSDLPLPQVLFGVPVQPHDWAWLDDEQYARARAALTEGASYHTGKTTIRTRLKLCEFTRSHARRRHDAILTAPA
jgi:hypothetical protein